MSSLHQTNATISQGISTRMRILSRTIRLADMRLLIPDSTCPALMGCILLQRLGSI